MIYIKLKKNKDVKRTMIIISKIPPEFYERTNENNRRSSNKTKKGDFKSILLSETSGYDPNDVLRYFSSKRR